MAMAPSQQHGSGRRALSRAVLLLLLSGVASAFKREEFKTCEQSRFCKENRNRVPAFGYQVTGAPRVSDFVAEFDVLGQEPNARFTLFVSGFSTGTARVRMVEAAKSRYEVEGILSEQLQSLATKLSNTQLSGNETWLTFSPTVRIQVTHAPLTINAYNGETLVAAFNSAGMFHFQHTLEAPDGDTSVWAETFRSHKDPMIHGPSHIAFDYTFIGAKHVYGIPERATSMALKPTAGEGVKSEPYRMYNLDVFEYELDSPFSLYGSIPYMLGHSAAGTSGVFWLNAAEMYVDVYAADAASNIKTHWITESGVLDLFVFTGPSASSVFEQYGLVVGTTPLPPMFSIGYHQCRWNYNDEGDVKQVDAGFDEHNIPYDVLWLDIEHTDGKRYMTWDPKTFPTPQKMIDGVSKKGRKMVTIIDPHMKRDGKFVLHQEASSKGYYVKTPDGKDYDGWCWSGSSSYLDVMNPEIRDWWASKFAVDKYRGSTEDLYVWNDMNEPSVFNGPEITMPKDNIHYPGVEHREIHNLYGYFYHLATWQGLYNRSKGTKRPFVLSRAFFAGTQRVGPIWTGDNTADWDHLRISLPMVMTLGLTGLPWSGADVGGFFGNPTPELMTRWYQMGAFYPFFRGHAHLDTKRREPWLFGEPYTSHIRDAIRLRYIYLPYLYTLFHETSVNGAPIVRPLWVEYPQDEKSFTIESQLLVGKDLLLAPVLEQGARMKEVYFPPGSSWFEIPSGRMFNPKKYASFTTLPVDLAATPLFQRAGSIIATRERPRRSTAAMTDDPYTLIIALDSDENGGYAEGSLYLDDGNSYEYQKGKASLRKFVFANGKLVASGEHGYGDTKTMFERIVILGMKGVPTAAEVHQGSLPPHAVTVEMGPLRVRAGVPSTAVVIRKPQVLAAYDWTITFK